MPIISSLKFQLCEHENVLGRLKLSYPALFAGSVSSAQRDIQVPRACTLASGKNNQVLR